MKLPLAPRFSTLADLAAWASGLASSIAAGWNVDHRDDGTHVFPWVRPTFTAAQFTGNSAMTWTVASGGVSSLKYMRVASTMTVSFAITGTVGGTPSNQLRIAIPDEARAPLPGAHIAGTFSYTDAGVEGTGIVQAIDRLLVLFKGSAAGNWTAGTAVVQGSVQFEVEG